MTRMCTGLVLVLVVALCGATSAAEDKMTRDEYRAQLAEFTEREANAQAGITATDARIATLQRQIQVLDSENEALHQQILGLVDASDAEIWAFGNELDELTNQLEGLMSLSPEDLLHHRTGLDDLGSKLGALQEQKMSGLPEMAAKISDIQRMLGQLNGRRPRSLSVNYTVAQGDNLWKISKKETIYDDPYMWPRIYRANRDQIKDPDMIFPNQVLAVPFGVSESQYLVTRGDFLSGIADAVYQDPTKWHKIYEANKEQIVEPNMIYPAQVFEIPAN